MGIGWARMYLSASRLSALTPVNPIYGVRNTPKVIGGATNACAEVSVALYSKIIDQVVPVSSTRAAEMVKLLENTFRSVNIGLVNEMAVMCDKLDVNVWEVIDAASTKPFGFHDLLPRTRPWRALHSHRSSLLELEAEDVELYGALH